MTTYNLSHKFKSHVKLSENVIAVANMFGLGTRRDRQVTLIEDCQIDINPGNVVYITGGSGAGKSLIVKLLKEKMTGYIDLNDLKIPSRQPLVDCFTNQSLRDVLFWLSSAGLSDAFAILRRPEHLSDGQRYRFRLAWALAQKPPVIFIDEFCATLDRVTAAVVSYNIRKFADRFDTTFIVATSHDDMLEDLRPDVVVIKHLGSDCDVYYPGNTRGTSPKAG